MLRPGGQPPVMTTAANGGGQAGFRPNGMPINALPAPASQLGAYGPAGAAAPAAGPHQQQYPQRPGQQGGGYMQPQQHQMVMQQQGLTASPTSLQPPSAAHSGRSTSTMPWSAVRQPLTNIICPSFSPRHPQATEDRVRASQESSSRAPWHVGSGADRGGRIAVDRKEAEAHPARLG